MASRSSAHLLLGLSLFTLGAHAGWPIETIDHSDRGRNCEYHTRIQWRQTPAHRQRREGYSSYHIIMYAPFVLVLCLYSLYQLVRKYKGMFVIKTMTKSSLYLRTHWSSVLLFFFVFFFCFATLVSFVLSRVFVFTRPPPSTAPVLTLRPAWRSMYYLLSHSPKYMATHYEAERRYIARRTNVLWVWDYGMKAGQRGRRRGS